MRVQVAGWALGSVLATLALGSCGSSGQPIESTCRAIDGDTLRCDPGPFGGDMIRLRLNGIDAPELHAPGGSESLMSLAELLHQLGPQVSYLPLKQDRYGRTVAQAYVNNIDLSCYQLITGQARYIKAWDERLLTAAGC